MKISIMLLNRGVHNDLIRDTTKRIIALQSLDKTLSFMNNKFVLVNHFSIRLTLCDVQQLFILFIGQCYGVLVLQYY